MVTGIFSHRTGPPKAQGFAKDEVTVTDRLSVQFGRARERGNESQIKDVTHYWCKWHRPVFIGSSSSRLRQPMCFLFSIQEMVSGHAPASAPDKPLLCLHCSVFGMTALLNHPWLSQLALNQKRQPKYRSQHLVQIKATSTKLVMKAIY